MLSSGRPFTIRTHPPSTDHTSPRIRGGPQVLYAHPATARAHKTSLLQPYPQDRHCADPPLARRPKTTSTCGQARRSFDADGRTRRNRQETLIAFPAGANAPTIPNLRPDASEPQPKPRPKHSIHSRIESLFTMSKSRMLPRSNAESGPLPIRRPSGSAKPVRRPRPLRGSQPHPCGRPINATGGGA